MNFHTHLCFRRIECVQRGYVLPPLTVLLAGATIIACVVALLFYNLYWRTANEFAEFRAAVELAQKQAVEESERINRQTAEGWAAAVDYWRNNPRVVRVRNDTCEMPVPPATGKFDETPVAGTISAEQCEAYLNDGIQDAAQLLWLQHWIRQQYEATK